MKNLTPFHKELLRLLLTYEKSILASLTSETTISDVEIEDNGNIVVYFKDSPKWIQRIFNSYKRITLTESALKTVKIIFNKLNDNSRWTDKNYQEFIMDIINKSTLEEDLPAVVDALFDVARLTEGTPLTSSYIKQTNSDKRQNCRQDSLDGANLFATVELRPGKTTNLFLGKVKE